MIAMISNCFPHLIVLRRCFDCGASRRGMEHLWTVRSNRLCLPPVHSMVGGEFCRGCKGRRHLDDGENASGWFYVLQHEILTMLGHTLCDVEYGDVVERTYLASLNIVSQVLTSFTACDARTATPRSARGVVLPDLVKSYPLRQPLASG